MNLDFMFFIIYLLQTFVLSSLPSGFHSNTPDGWRGFYISLIFIGIFYSVFYFIFYQSIKQQRNFIREMIIFSVIARIHAFIVAGSFAVAVLFIWGLFKLPRNEGISLFFYLFYYALFSLFMIRMKKLTYQ